MSDEDLISDEREAKRCQDRERAYTEGWRAYLAGSQRPRGNGADVQGWLDAAHAEQACKRDIRWSIGFTDEVIRILPLDCYRLKGLEGRD
jgi:hypothetical protein